MTTKLVIRLLDAAGSLLGWTEHHAAVRGDGCLRASHDVSIVTTAAGVCPVISAHWADVNVEVRVDAAVSAVQAGESRVVFPKDAPIIFVGAPPVGLPPVTVGRMSVVVPAGGLGSHAVPA